MEYFRISWNDSSENEPEEETVGNLKVPANLPSGELSVGNINPLDMETLISQRIRVHRNGFCHIHSLEQR